MSYAKKQKKWIKKHDVRVGDFVKVVKRAGSDWVDYMNDSVGEIYDVIAFDDPNMFIILKDGFGYSKKSLKKITDLKEIAPFYVKIESKEQFKRVLNIMLSYGLGDEKDLIENFMFPSNYGSDGNFKIQTERDVLRELTYEQLLRFEKKQEEKEVDKYIYLVYEGKLGHNGFLSNIYCDKKNLKREIKEKELDYCVFDNIYINHEAKRWLKIDKVMTSDSIYKNNKNNP